MAQYGIALCAAVCAGAVVGLLADVRTGDALGVTVALLAVAPLALRRGRRIGGATCLLACGGLATLQGAVARDHALRPPLVAWLDALGPDWAAREAAEAVEVEGVLAADAARVPGGVRLLIDVSAVRDATGWHRAPGRVQAHVAGDLAFARVRDWTAGRRVRAPMVLRRPPMLLNFGGASPRWQLLRRPFALAASVKSGAVVDLVDVERAAWRYETAAALRRRVRDAAAQYIAPANPHAAAIVTAILIGDRAGLDDEVERRLQAAGTYHVIAISGGNVALLAAISFGLFRLLWRSARAGAAGTLVTIVAYGWVVGGDPSVARAVTAASVYLGASVIGLSPTPLAVLRTVAIVMVLWKPTTTIDAGAWLSFGATFGIIAFAMRWAPTFPRVGGKGFAGAAIRLLAMAIVATLAAEALVLPVSAAVFGRVSIAGVALNLVAVPAMAVVQLAGMLTVILAAVWPAAAAASGDLTRVSADVLVGSSGLVEVLPWLSWRVPPVSAWWTFGYLAALGAGIVTTGRRRRVAAGVAGMALVVILTAPAVSREQPPANRLRVTMIDVGQGDAILVQAGGGFSLLIDTGGSVGPFDVGGRVVTPAAWALGTRRLTSLALTHGDRDHVGGAMAVIRDLAPRDVWEGVPVPRDRERASLRALAASIGAAWRTVHAGSRLEWGELVIEAWHPLPPEWERQKVRNDDSLVLRLRYGHADIWLTGDAGVEFESRVTAIPDAGRLRILKVGHHGSRTSTSARFVDALRPQIAIVSAGRGNLFGHPAPDVLGRLEAAGASVFRTDRDGAVVIETDGVTARVQTALGRTWTVSVPPGPP